MNAFEDQVARHYTTANLLGRIRAGIEAEGFDPDTPPVDALKPVDEFHSGGLEATDRLLVQLSIRPETRILDVGSGLGGTARRIASRHGARVTGIDLTPAFVQTATTLSTLVGLDSQTSFYVASALDLPEPDNAMDLVLMLHVGMNIAQKASLFAEISRVLAPGGTFALYDVMQTGPSVPTYPMPWADQADLAEVAPPVVYREAGLGAGFKLVNENARGRETITFFARVDALMGSKQGPPPLGIHLLMGDNAALKIRNYRTALNEGTLAPVEMIFRKPR